MGTTAAGAGKATPMAGLFVACFIVMTTGHTNTSRIYSLKLLLIARNVTQNSDHGTVSSREIPKMPSSGVTLLTSLFVHSKALYMYVNEAQERSQAAEGPTARVVTTVGRDHTGT